ncbi:MAG: SCO6880 family protein, partial [Nocardioides sp.]
AEEVARDLAARLPHLAAGLTSAGAGAARPMTAQELCETIRSAYSISSATRMHEAYAAGETPELLWNEVGPAAHVAEWDHYRHDDAVSCTWSMTVPPRGNVQSSILARLLSPHRDIDRKRVTLLYRPIDSARTAALVEADLRTAAFLASTSERPTARSKAAERAAEATAHEEASGAGLVNFGLLVTATVTSQDRLADAQAAVENLGATARLRLRPVYGSQDSAFAAALPLGLVLPRHLKVPAELSGRL